jgi:hypothetical protein
MKVLSLRCTHGHGFEGWFGSEDDYRTQAEAGQIQCPLCGDAQITRLPTAARFNRSSRSTVVGPPAEGNPPGDAVHASDMVSGPQGAEALWLQAVRHVLARTEDVGTRFADEARRIHYGEVPERGIRGQATPEQAEALRDEGIDVHSLPVPESLKGPLQ